MRYPDFLQPGGTIGFIAPAFGCATEPYKTAFLNAQRKFADLGFQMKLGPNCFESSGIGISNTPQKCAEELMDFYERADTDVLISCGGGELMCEILPYLDPDRLKAAKPKWFQGFSDNTNFTMYSATVLDTAAFYAPNAASFGMEPWHMSISESLELLMGQRSEVHNFHFWEKEGGKTKEQPLLPYNITEPVVIHRFLPEAGFPDSGSNGADEKANIDGGHQTEDGGPLVIEGRLLGGCLDCLAQMCGTDFDHVKEFSQKYKEDGIIFYTEACDLTPLGIRRALWQLKYCGWFEHVKAFLIGRPHHFGEVDFGLDQYEAVTSVLGDLKVPILMDLDIGHVAPMMPLICGASVIVNSSEKNIKISYTWR